MSKDTMQRSSAFVVVLFLWISHYNILATINLEVGLLVGVNTNDPECNQTTNNNVSVYIIVLEAYLYGIQKANQELEKIGINLQPRILPYCRENVLVYKQIVNATLEQQKAMCTPDSQPPTGIIAIIAHTYSAITTVVTSILQELCVPLIASSATDPDLDHFPYFVRSMPNDVYQARFLWEVLKSTKATPVIILYDSTNYALNILSELRKLSNLNASVVCIEEEIEVASLDHGEYEHITERLENVKPAAIVLLTSLDVATKFFTHLKDNAPELRDKFLFFGPDTWCGMHVNEEEMPIPESTIGVMSYLGEDDEFRGYLASITLEKACEGNKLELAEVIAKQQMCNDSCGSSSNCNKSATLFLDGDGVGAMFRAKYFIQSIMQLKEAIQLMFHSCNSALKCSEIWANFRGYNLVEYMRQSGLNTTYGLFTFSEDQKKWQYIESYDVSFDSDLEMSEDVLSKLPRVNETECKNKCPGKNMKQSGTCCLVCEPCGDIFSTFNKDNKKCEECKEGQVADFNETGKCVYPKVTRIGISDGSFVVTYVLIAAGIIFLLMMTVIILLKPTEETRRLLCSEANIFYIIAALIHFVSCITCTVPLSHIICYVIWISSSFGSTVASAANLMHLTAYSYAPRQGDNHLYFPLLFRSCSSSKIWRRGLMLCLILAQVIITVILVVTVKNCSQSVPFGMDIVKLDYVTTCEWSIEFFSVLLVFPICTVVLVLILAMQMSGIVISIVRRQIKNIWVASMIVVLTDMLLLPINSGAFDVAKDKRMTFFLVYSLAQAYILILFLLVPFAYTVLWRQSRSNSGAAKVADTTARRI